MHNTQHIDVGYVANLARLELTDDEQSLFQRQLETILAYVEKLGELKLEGIEPTAYGQPVFSAMRGDDVTPGLAREQVLANAPARRDDEFQVPRIVE